MGKALTQTEFRKRCKILGWIPYGKFVNTNKPVPMKCPRCGNICAVRPHNIFSGTTKSCGCYKKLRTSEQRLTQTEFRKRCKQLGWIPCGKYVHSKIPVKMKCPRCGSISAVRPNNIFTGTTKSCGCYKKLRTSEIRKLSIEEVQRRFLAKGFVPPDNYQGQGVPVETVCPFCSKRFKTTLQSIFSRHTKSCGCYNRAQTSKRSKKDIKGLRHGLLTAIRSTDRRKRKRVIWEFKCDCGGTICLTINDLNNYKSCGCMRYPKGADSAIWRGIGSISGSFWAGFRLSAKRRGHKIKISIADAWSQFLKQDGRCALSGVVIEFAPSTKQGNNTASLDRIENAKDYIPGNVQWLHKIVNKMKRGFSEERFLQLCRLVAKPIRAKTPAKSCVIGKPHGNFRGYGNISQNYWRSVVQGTSLGKFQSQRLKIQLGISIEDAWEAFMKQKGRCALTNLELDFDIFIGSKSHKKYFLGSASLDRIDSKKSYTKDNIQWVHKDVNLMKWDFNDNEIKKWCKLVVKHYAKRETNNN